MSSSPVKRYRRVCSRSIMIRLIRLISSYVKLNILTNSQPNIRQWRVLYTLGCLMSEYVIYVLMMTWCLRRRTNLVTKFSATDFISSRVWQSGFKKRHATLLKQIGQLMARVLQPTMTADTGETLSGNQILKMVTCSDLPGISNCQKHSTNNQQCQIFKI